MKWQRTVVLVALIAGTVVLGMWGDSEVAHVLASVLASGGVAGYAASKKDGGG